MRAVILSIFLIVVSTMANPISLESQWESFKTNNGKTYDSEEEVRRFAIFKENIQKIEEHNKKYDAGEVTYKMGINQFTDLTPEEFKKHLGLRSPNQRENATKDNA